jgi:arsenate reductase
MNVTLYGIPNCDTIKKAKDWLKQNAISYTFVDFKKSPPDLALLNKWCIIISWETLLNKQGSTWKKIPTEIQSTITTKESALALLIKYPSLIKRPVLEIDHKIKKVGFNPDLYKQLF